ncbi:MAG: DNA-deoxyinosine glycosylase [Sphingomicrobium sp.]
MTPVSTFKASMAPVGAEDARLLVLGSLPGDASLAAQRYYAHPTNMFWRLLGSALEEPLVGLDYTLRLERLAARGVALWDVIERAERPGSLDGAIRDATQNPLAAFVAGHPRLEAIGFNGKTAAMLGRRALGPTPLSLIDLPSSSAAYTAGFDAKAGAWRTLAAFVDPA